MLTPKSQLQHAEKSANVLKTIAHPLRLGIVELLSRPDTEPIRVSDIVLKLEQPQAVVSQHLIHLKDRGVLTSSKVGTNVYYTPAIQGLFEVIQAVIVLTKA